MKQSRNLNVTMFRTTRALAFALIAATFVCESGRAAQNPDGSATDVAADSVADYVDASIACGNDGNCPPPTDGSDPFDASACTGSDLSFAEAASHFSSGSTIADLGRVAFKGRTRQCTTSTGCTGWTATDLTGSLLASDTGVAIALTSHANFYTETNGIFFGIFAEDAQSSAAVQLTGSLITPNSCPPASVRYFKTLTLRTPSGYSNPLLGASNVMALAVRTHCAVAIIGAKTNVLSNGAWIEYQLGTVTHY